MLGSIVPPFELVLETLFVLVQKDNVFEVLFLSPPPRVVGIR